MSSLKEEAKLCPTCDYKFNQCKRKKVVCGHCQFVTCAWCVKNYILKNSFDPRCMNPPCKHSWNKEFIYQIFPRAVVHGELKTHRENVLYEREKALLPATQSEAKIYKFKSDSHKQLSYIKKVITKICNQRKLLVREECQLDPCKLSNCADLQESTPEEKAEVSKYNMIKNMLSTRAWNSPFYLSHYDNTGIKLIPKSGELKVKHEKKLQELYVIEKNLKQKMIILERKLQILNIPNIDPDEFDNLEEVLDNRNLFNTWLHKRQHGVPPAEKEKSKVYIRVCPAPECRGYLRENWICELCQTVVCSKCHEIKILKVPQNEEEKDEKDEEKKTHKCVAANVKTAKMIHPCPKCSVSISRIDGCDHMFCSQCHTIFDWETGEIGTTSTNPEYHKWLRENNIKLDASQICANGILYSLNREVSKLSPLIPKLHVQVLHIYQIELPKYRRDQIVDNKEYRIKYLVGEITDIEFKRHLQRVEKKREKDREVYQIIETYCLISFMIMRNFTPQTYVIQLEELAKLKTHANDSLKKLCLTYDCVRISLDSYMGAYQEMLHGAIDGMEGDEEEIDEEDEEEIDEWTEYHSEDYHTDEEKETPIKKEIERKISEDNSGDEEKDVPTETKTATEILEEESTDEEKEESTDEEKDYSETEEQFLEYKKCVYLYKKGKQKGKECGKLVRVMNEEKGYCTIHKTSYRK